MNYSRTNSRVLLSRSGIFLLLLIIVALFSCSWEKKANWTILVYMAADNNLSPQAEQDIIEMERADLLSSVNVVVQLDPYQYSSDPRAKRYEITHNLAPYIASPVVEVLGDIDSGDYHSLADFVNWGVSRYPANHYALVIWSHGTGWTRDEGSRYICPDNSSLNQISIAGGDLRRAFQLFPRKMDILVIDACFMQTIEVVTEVYQYTSFIVGSENTVPVEGFPYQEVLELWNHFITPRNLAIYIVNRYISSHLPGGSQNPWNFDRQLTCSTVETSRLPRFLALLQQFSIDWLSIAGSPEVKSAREESFAFNYPRSDIDLKQFFTLLYDRTDNPLLQEDISEIITTLDELFIAQAAKNLPENTGTATIWFPVYEDYFTGSRELYSNLLFAQTGWLNFLEASFTSE